MKLFISFLFFFPTLINLFAGVANATTKILIRGSNNNWNPHNSNEEYPRINKKSRFDNFMYDFDKFMDSSEGKHLFAPVYGEMIKLITTDIYKNLKGAIKNLFKSLRRKIVLLKIRALLKKWWIFILPKLEGGLKFSKSAKQDLKKCFYLSGIDAYKKIVLDIKETKGEFFFMTLIEFKKRCITNKYSDNNLLAMNFKKLENSAAYLTHFDNLNRGEVHEPIKN